MFFGSGAGIAGRTDTLRKLDLGSGVSPILGGSGGSGG
jgi:hypothetical protein